MISYYGKLIILVIYLRSVSTIVAVVIIVGITMAITVAVALWLSGVITSNSYGTGVTKLTILDLESYGRLTKIIVWNSGSTTASINGVYIDEKPVRVRVAYNAKDKSEYRIYINRTIGDEPFTIKPGDTVDLWVVTNKPLEPGVLYNVKITLSNGESFMMPLRVSRAVSENIHEVGLACFVDPAPKYDPPIRLWLNWSGSVAIYINGKQTYSSLTSGPTTLYPNDYVSTRILKPGLNILAVEYNSSTTTYIDLSLYVQRFLINGVKSWTNLFRNNGIWKTFNSTNPPSPDSRGNQWYSPQYNDTSWKTIQAPAGTTGYYATYSYVPNGYTEYYRAVIPVPSKIDGVPVTSIVNATIRVASDDNSTVYLNGVKVYSDTSYHGYNYWNYVYTISDTTKYSLAVGGKAVLAIAVYNDIGDYYFDVEIQFRLKLANGNVVSYIWPNRILIKYKILSQGQQVPNGWYLPDFDDSSWSTGYLPMGYTVDTSAGLVYNTIDSSTGLTASRILIRIHMDLGSNNMPVALDNEEYYNANYTGYNGYLVLFDVVDWKFKYYKLYNPTGDPRRTSQYIVIGAGGVEGSLSDVFNGIVKPIYSGNPYLLLGTISAEASRYNSPPTSPIILYVNPYSSTERNFTWTSLNTSYIDRFILIKEPEAVPGLDIIVLWEDMWKSPTWTDDTDQHSWVDEALRITWLENGSILIGVYRASGDWLHAVIIAGKLAYFKPHYDEYGTNTSQPWTALDDLNGDGKITPTEQVHWEIGYDPITGTITQYRAPSGAVVTIWKITP